MMKGVFVYNGNRRFSIIGKYLVTLRGYDTVKSDVRYR